MLFLSEIPATEVRAFLEQKRKRVDENIIGIEKAIAVHNEKTPAYYTLRHHELHLKTERA